MSRGGRTGTLSVMPSFLLHHTHTADECAAAFAAWHGFASPLRSQAAASTCLAGGHALWWRVQATSANAALALLPPYVARRTNAIAVRDIQIP
jgi:hypothetical protein